MFFTGGCDIRCQSSEYDAAGRNRPERVQKAAGGIGAVREKIELVSRELKAEGKNDIAD